MASLNWSKLSGQSEFDRIVESLFIGDNADLGPDAFAVNGRGGDKGIDIHIRRDDNLAIVQLKFFPEGFSGGFATTRRRQIKKSFTAALQHDPDEWWLVVPHTLTPGERRYVTSLGDGTGSVSTQTEVVVFDATKLDILASKHPTLVTYFLRDDLREAAQVYSQEKALLINQADLVSRVAALAERSDTLDPDWRLDVFTKDGVIGTQLVAKHPHAAERSPITVTMRTTFTDDQDDLRRAFEQAVSFGAPERIDLPASVVSSFVVEGPPAFAYSTAHVDVSWFPASSELVGQPFSLVLYDDRGKRVASFPGKIVWTGGAGRGVSIHAEFFSALTLKFQLPFDDADSATVNVSMEFGGREPSDVVRAVTLLDKLDSDCVVALEIDGVEGGRLSPLGQQQSVFGDQPAAIRLHAEVAADLAVVQEVTSQYFPYPR